MVQRLLAGLLVLASVVCAQRRVDPRFSYVRVIAVVPLIGQGTQEDPRRPQYAPWPAATDPNGIIAFSFVPSDDGRLAIVEFVARSRSAFEALLADKNITALEKGRVSKTSLEAAVRTYRKDFDLNKFGMVMP
jgi:hypothetical protein